MEIQAAVLYAANDIHTETRYLPEPSRLELQVAVKCTGLCGSDLHYYKEGRNGDIQIREPLALGHESAGVVMAVGASVTGFAVGDKVALEVGVPCDDCARCREGRYNICRELKFRSSAKSFPHFQGTLQERLNHPAKWCHKLPQSMSLELGALLEPIGVGIHAIRRAQLEPDSTVLVFGAGAVGLLTAAVARAKGAREVVIADIDHARVAFAVRHGFADSGFHVPSRRGNKPDDTFTIAKQLAAAIADVQGPSGLSVGDFDTVFECTGVGSCVQAAIFAARSGGKVMLIGMGEPVQTLPLAAAALREVDLIGVFRYANTYPEGIEILSQTSKRSPCFAALVSHRFLGLDKVKEAFETAKHLVDHEGRMVLKVVVHN